MKKLLILIAAFLFILQSAKTQNLTYLAVNIGPKFDHYQLNDQGDGILYKPVIGNKFGFTIGREFFKNLFAEAGFSYNQVWNTTYYKVFPQSYGSSSVNLLYEFPVRFIYRYPVYKDKISLSGSIGFTGALNTDNGYGGHSVESNEGLGGENDSVSTHSVYTFSDKKFMPFLHAGISADYKFKNKLIISIGTEFSYGIRTLYNEDMVYKVNTEEEQTANKISKGTNQYVYMNIKFPISNIWDKSEENITRKENIQKYMKEGKKVYASVSAGVYKPRFMEDNPEITGNDYMINFGDNTSLAKVNFGANIYKKWILETGFNMYGYRNCYMIKMDENSAQGGSFSGSPYYGVPLTIKYDLTLFSNRLSIMPNLGTSLIFSTQSGLYSSTEFGGYYTKDDQLINETIYLNAYHENGPSFLIDAGLGIEYAFGKHFILMLNTTYEKGFEDFNRLNVDYVSDISEKNGNIFFQGNNLNITAGIKVPFNL